MDYQTACNSAARRANVMRSWRYVVIESRDARGNPEYAPASDWQLDTVYNGCPVVATFLPDGQPEREEA